MFLQVTTYFKAGNVKPPVVDAIMTTEWGALSGYGFCSSGLAQRQGDGGSPDRSKGRDARKRFSHSRLDQLFQMQLTADKSARYAQYRSR